jgi:L-histidine N-alpha-methyltransferase
MNTQFYRDVLDGLTSNPKYLSSKYFYDARGDKLFQQIMALPEYYLTRCEYSILKKYRKELFELFSASESNAFDLIELGAGDGTKTKLLLEHFVKKKSSFTYYPIDISENVLKQLINSLQQEMPELQVKGIPKDYFSSIKEINAGDRSGKKVVLFLGSNVGNFNKNTAASFLQQLSGALNPGDDVLIGLDLKKDPRIVQKAYDDDAGVTKAFNLNLLERINRELKADFNPEHFVHYAIYDPQDGSAKSYLISSKDQTVNLLGKTISFAAWEAIHVETSQKFDQKMINTLAANSGFEIVKNFFDEKSYFVDTLWRKK